jgi:hypothetical protein
VGRGEFLVVEGTAVRVTATPALERASRALVEVFDWPTTVVGDELDAPYAARAFAFPTDDSSRHPVHLRLSILVGRGRTKSCHESVPPLVEEGRSPVTRPR